jgi:drug/metabolite transporter (DMT)-like permease
MTFVAQARGAEVIPAFTFNAARFVIGVLALLPVMLWTERKNKDKEKLRTTLRAGLICGVIVACASSLQQLGFDFGASAGKAGFITGLYIVFVPIIGAFLRQRPSVFVWVGAAAACAGLYFLSVADGFGSVTAGDVVLIFNAVMWAVQILVINKFSREIYIIRFTVIQFTVCALLSVSLALIFDDAAVTSIAGAAVPLLYCGIFSVGIAYPLQVVGQKGTPPAKAAIIFSLEALFAALAGALLLGERMGLRGYLGCFLIFGGIMLSQLRVKRYHDIIQKHDI